MKSLVGKVALVSGASRSIGKGIALSLGEVVPQFMSLTGLVQMAKQWVNSLAPSFGGWKKSTR